MSMLRINRTLPQFLSRTLRIRVSKNENKSEGKPVEEPVLDKWGRVTPKFKDPSEEKFYNKHGKTFSEYLDRNADEGKDLKIFVHIFRFELELCFRVEK